MSSIQPAYPEKISVEYARPGSDAIPMPMYSGEPIEMKQADVFKEPIVMQAQNASDQDQDSKVEELKKD